MRSISLFLILVAIASASDYDIYNSDGEKVGKLKERQKFLQPDLKVPDVQSGYQKSGEVIGQGFRSLADELRKAAEPKPYTGQSQVSDQIEIMNLRLALSRQNRVLDSLLKENEIYRELAKAYFKASVEYYDSLRALLPLKDTLQATTK